MIDLGALGTSGDLNSAGKGINTAGQVVGYSELLPSSETHAFLYMEGAMYDLNAFVLSGLDGATLTEAVAINDRGQIAANYCFPVAITDTECNAFRLDPIAAPTVVAVEYYYEAWNYYFETSSPDEISVLDGGAFGGVWKRTGQTFNVWPEPNTSSSPTCRFFSTAFAPKSTHVYTPFASECASLTVNPDWQYEGIAFYIAQADAVGLCAVGTIPLYRLYNNGMGGAPNHRYTTSETILNQMMAAGWIFEGNGDTKVFACVPQ
jgi:probable HAF family extracellular repeat protein